MNLVTWLGRAARADPGRTAIYAGTRPWASYGELARRVASLAAGLRGQGLAPCDRVALAMPNRPEYIVAMQRPKEYRFVERLPKNHYGKVVKTQLRESLNHD